MFPMDRFQSPLHRGTSSDSKFMAARNLGPRFNPLFIGAHLLTGIMTCLSLLISKFLVSIPSSSGHIF